MSRILITIVTAVIIATGALLAHDASKHKGKPVQGEVVSTAADRFELKTEAGVLPVTFSSKTKFEHDNATVDKTHVTKGERVTVFGTKLPNGEMVAREVLIGAGSTHTEHGSDKAPASSKPVKKGSAETHKHD
jgi:methionine-rich copper-binding protein CopC